MEYFHSVLRTFIHKQIVVMSPPPNLDIIVSGVLLPTIDKFHSARCSWKKFPTWYNAHADEPTYLGHGWRIDYIE